MVINRKGVEEMQLLTLADKYWKKPLGLFFSLCVNTYLSYKFISEIISLIDLETLGTISPIIIKIGFPLMANVLIFLIWLWHTRPTKTPKGMLGIVIALKAESKEKHEILLHNFVSRIKEGLTEKYYIHTVTLEEENNLSTPDSIQKYLNDRTAVLFIKSTFREDIKKYELSLSTMVLHAKVEKEVNDYLQNDLNLLTPKFQFNKENSIKSFEVSSSYLKVYAKYFVAYSIALGGQFEKCYYLFNELKEELKILNFKRITQFRDKVNEHLETLLVVLSRNQFEIYWNTYDVNTLQKQKYYLGELGQINMHSYEYKLGMATYYFLNSRDISKAMKCLEGVRNQPAYPHHWYSFAFLYGYAGNLEEMLKMYRKAFKKTNEHHVYYDVERFVTNILEMEPDKYHLHLSLALINDFKGDYQLAQVDYNKFIKRATNKEIYDSKRLLQYIVQGISINVHQAHDEASAALENTN